jgi:hypothetical protein
MTEAFVLLGMTMKGACERLGAVNEASARPTATRPK